MSAKTDTAKKRANGHRSRKGTNGKVINAKHNDRNFDVSKADHINENLIDKNVVWKYVDVNEGGEKEEEKKAAEEQKSESELRETLDDYEEKVYEKYFSKALENRNEKQIKARHKDRVQTMEQYRLNAKFCPEESIWTIGNRDNRIEPELLQTIWEEFTAWHKETYPNVLMLDATLHLDEPNAAPHIHRRDVWRYEVDGHWEISQKEALKAMGIERPDLSKKESKYNNAKMTYTAQTRAKWIEIAERHGIEIEKEPQEKSRSGLTMLQLKKRTLEEQIAKFENDIAVLDLQYENKSEIDKNLDKEISEKEKQLSKKTAELDGINARIAEAKKIVMTKDIPPRPDVKELPENPTRKDKKEHEKELQAAKEWDDKYKQLQAVQIAAKANVAKEKAIENKRLVLNKNIEDYNVKEAELQHNARVLSNRIAKQEIIVEKEVQRRLAPHNFAQKQLEENERYLQKQRSLFAEDIEHLQEQGKAEQERKQQLFEKVKYKTTKKTKGDWER